MACFINNIDDGDDSDGNIHMSQADALCNIIDNNYNNYNFEKLYLDIYNQESTPLGFILEVKTVKMLLIGELIKVHYW